MPQSKNWRLTPFKSVGKSPAIDKTAFDNANLKVKKD